MSEFAWWLILMMFGHIIRISFETKRIKSFRKVSGVAQKINQKYPEQPQGLLHAKFIGPHLSTGPKKSKGLKQLTPTIYK